MDLILLTAFCFILLIVSVFTGIYLALPLGLAFILFFLLALRRGAPARELFRMAWEGGKKSLIVIRVFLIIGALIATWIAAGTVPAIVHFGFTTIRPSSFILVAFLTSAATSTLIGTSVGTTGIVGIAFILIARSGGVNLAATTGALVSGAYFGDRCSPMSSSASLVAFLTSTDIYRNIRNMVRTSLVPFVLSSLAYLGLSLLYPLTTASNAIMPALRAEFLLGWPVLLPIFVVVLASAFRIKVRRSMLASTGVALLVAFFYQDRSLGELGRYLLTGFVLPPESPLAAIMKGGGLLSMLRIALIVYIASALTGIIEGTKMLQGLERFTERVRGRGGAYRSTLVASLFAAMIGCSQTVAVMLTHLISKGLYQREGLDGEILAVDLENTAILVSALIPWNLTLLAPVAILGTDFTCVPFIFYAYAVPLWNLAVSGSRAKTPSAGRA